MSNQAKRLSDCAAERLAQCRGEAVPHSGVAVECAICASLGDQCVTCEDAEFAVWADRHFAAADYRQTTAGVFVQDWMRHSFSAWQARSAHITRLQAEVSALQQRLNTADQRASDLTWLAKAAYMEGWELGWITRHTDANNEKRVTPWAPPRELMEREWLTSEGRAALDQPAPAQDVRAVADGPALPELNSDLRKILGRPNFTCHSIAKALRLMGFDIPQKSEEEQAVTIYWMLGHYLRDPVNWRDAASGELKASMPEPPAQQ